MIVIRAIQALLLLFTVFWAVYVLALPLVARMRRTREKAPVSSTLPAIAVIIPAHNMASEIEACVMAIRAANYPADRLGIHVVADHCADDTAQRARSAGASALIRSQEPPGKTYAIAWLSLIHI